MSHMSFCWSSLLRLLLPKQVFVLGGDARLLAIWGLIAVCGLVGCASNQAFAQTPTVAQTSKEAESQPAEFFRQRVEPILRQHCYGCHSHEAKPLEGGLALDWKSGWQSGGDRGPAIVPGSPGESLLIKAVMHQENALRMPEEKLAEAEIAVLVKWVQDGAWDNREVKPIVGDARDWWSLRPLSSPSIPLVNTNSPQSLGDNPVDAFIAAKLTQSGLSFSPPAQPRELVRRLYFDLVGLPPAIGVVEQFAKDPSQQAYEALVDQLLASKYYGQRWARHWMDTIHFAESHGYEHDVGRDNAWPYRDYLINAFNRDLDWTTFVRQQMAVDYFEPESTELLPALGFLGAGTFDLSTYSTGPVTFDYLDRDDMLTQTMAAFVSTTANCARCHAHKFDPISQDDYYALQAVFSGVLKGDITYDPQPTIAAQRKQLTELRDAATRRDPARLQGDSAAAMLEQWLQTQAQPVVWSELQPSSFVSTDGATLTRDDKGIILATGTNPAIDNYVISTEVFGSTVWSAIRLDLFPHDSLPASGPGRCKNGNLHLSEVSVAIFEPGSNSSKAARIVRASADFNQSGWSIDRAIDGNTMTAWGIHPEVGKPHHAIFVFAEPLVISEKSRVTITLRQLHGESHLIGAFRLSSTNVPTEHLTAIPQDVQAALETPADQRTPQQTLILKARAVQEIAQADLAALPKPSRVYAVASSVEIPAGNGTTQAATIASPKTVNLLWRGEIDKPKHVVLPGALSTLDHLPARFSLSSATAESERRGALADWIAHRDNVLTWRSVVNRVWHYHFGAGLCDTPSDFGRMGGVPSHPELIDWLAVWFRDHSGQSLKKLHRLIVTSRTYQQSSQPRQDAQQVDATNRLLWRQNSLRMDADTFRDSVLVVSGQLDDSVGGPSAQHFKQSRGPQSTPALDYKSYDWDAPGSNRRSIYRYVWRGIPDPLFNAMDFPDLGLLAPTRGSSASPLQSLSLLNNTFVLHFSKSMADQISEGRPNVEQQVREAVRRSYLREPHPPELIMLQRYAGEHGLPALCRVLFNSNEFLFIP